MSEGRQAVDAGHDRHGQVAGLDADASLVGDGRDLIFEQGEGPIPGGAQARARLLDRPAEHDLVLRGLLSGDAQVGRAEGPQPGPGIIVQYWRSYEELERWARYTRQRHLPAWRDFMKRVGLSGDVGIWHETYRITPGNYETIYTNMPRFGLAAATKAVAITSCTDHGRARMDRPARRRAP